MDIRLSWDLFVIVFFIIIVAYSFIIGRDNTLKVILGTYVSAIAADAFGNLFDEYFGGSAFFLKILKFANIGTEEESVIFVKVMVFISLVILFAVKGAFDVNTVDDRSPAIRFILLVIYAFMSAGLIISCILVFVSGVSLIGGSSLDGANNALLSMYNKSKLLKMILNNSYLLFSMPALAFLAHSLYSTKSSE